MRLLVGPRVISVLAGGLEGPLNERDLDLRDPSNWSFWNASVHAGTMGTLALERLARENPRLSIVHWFPGSVATPGLVRAQRFGMSPPNPTGQREAGARALFLATSDRYAVHGGGLVPIPQSLAVVKKSGGGISLVLSALTVFHLLSSIQQATFVNKVVSINFVQQC